MLKKREEKTHLRLDRFAQAQNRTNAIFGLSVPDGGELQLKRDRMISLWHFSTVLAFVSPALGSSYNLDSLTDSLLREVINRNYLDDYLPTHEEQPGPEFPSKAFQARRDAILSGEPSIRDEEYLEHSSLFGHKAVAGGSGEGLQRLRPEGSIENSQIVKTDALPAYCRPPNPCPLGYNSDDGCLEDFENTATFSRDYQNKQQCIICDAEHMFDCPGSTRENEIDALARTFENEGLADAALDRLIKTMEIEGEHKTLVAKKFFSHKPLNPFLEGEKLPVVAKKAPKSSIK